MRQVLVAAIKVGLQLNACYRKIKTSSSKEKNEGTIPDAGVKLLLKMLLGNNSKAKLGLKDRLFLLDKP